MSGPGAQGSLLLKPTRLKRRSDFLAVAKGRRWHARAFTLQARERDDATPFAADESELARVGYTLTKKVGNAVVRNRARRRLREAVRLGALPLRAGHDYVLVGRVEACRIDFAALKAELLHAVQAVHRLSQDASSTQNGGLPRERGPRRGKSRAAASAQNETVRQDVVAQHDKTAPHTQSTPPELIGRTRPEP